MIYSLFIAVESAFGQTWTQAGAPGNEWNSVASSADGTKLVAVADGGICTSTNSGMSWMSNSLPGYGAWPSVASSADGNKLVVVNNSGQIFTSTDSGTTWASNSLPNQILQAVASSSDGTRLVTVAYLDGGIFTSSNSGATWQQTGAPNNNWTTVASSADGTRLVATVGNISLPGPIYASTNSGATWMQTGAPSNNWLSVASSADGGRLAAISGLVFTTGGWLYLSAIYTSTNSGATWISNSISAAGSQLWQSVASSADGYTLVAVAQSQDAIYVSKDAGATWTSNSVPEQVWHAAASSADGNALVAAAINSGTPPDTSPGVIYTSYSTPTPRLDLAPSSDKVALSWLVPSANFVLQENDDLTTSNWVTVTDPPVLNLTNLYNQVMLAPTNSSSFFRLITQ
jgi:photosystem II stability/assembly factor-like uncharacterized protein